MFFHDVVRTVALVAPLLAGLAHPPGVCIAADAVKGLKLTLPKATQQRVSDFYSSNKYALVVGINRYQNGRQGIAALKYAVGDARAVYNALVDPRVGGFKPDHVTLLTDDERPVVFGKGGHVEYSQRRGREDVVKKRAEGEEDV